MSTPGTPLAVAPTTSFDRCAFAARWLRAFAGEVDRGEHQRCEVVWTDGAGRKHQLVVLATDDEASALRASR